MQAKKRRNTYAVMYSKISFLLLSTIAVSLEPQMRKNIFINFSHNRYIFPDSKFYWTKNKKTFILKIGTRIFAETFPHSFPKEKRKKGSEMGKIEKKKIKKKRTSAIFWEHAFGTFFHTENNFSLLSSISCFIFSTSVNFFATCICDWYFLTNFVRWNKRWFFAKRR